MLFTSLGRSVFGKTVPEVLSTALGLGPRALLRASREEATLKVPALRLVNVSKEVISVIEENSIAKSTIDATEFGGKLFSTQI